MLADFDLHVPPGQTVAIVGRTGAGKSTVARLLTRFYDVRHGSVELDGHDVRDLTLASLRANVGVVLDEPFLFSVSVHDNIAYGKPSADPDEVVAAAKAAGRPRVHLPPGRGLRRRRRRTGLHPVGRPAPTHRHRPHPAGQSPGDGPRRRHQRHRRPGGADHPRRPEGPDGGPDHPDHRPPAVDHLAGRPGGPARPPQGGGRRHPCRAAGHHPAVRRGPGPGGRVRGRGRARGGRRGATGGRPTTPRSGPCSTPCGEVPDDVGWRLRWRRSGAASADLRPRGSRSPVSPPSCRPASTGWWPPSPTTPRRRHRSSSRTPTRRT